MSIRKARGARMRPLTAIIALVALAFLFAGCGPDAPQPKRAKKQAAAKGPVIPTLPALASGDAGLDEVTGSAEEVFDPKGLRNPFKPFFKLENVKKKKKSDRKVTAFVPKTPLQRFALEELRLVGIIWQGKKNPEALIQDPSGKGYNVRTGTYVGDRGGKIVRIRKDVIVIEERTVDVLGEQIIKQNTMKLHKPENEVNP